MNYSLPFRWLRDHKMPRNNNSKSNYIHQLPITEDILICILEKLPFDDVSKARRVCCQFNVLCGQILNRGFAKAKQLQATQLKEVKDCLPRRESERRKHVLFPKQDILHSLETRLSLLHMTYYKYISAGQCCFIPGKVLDEVFTLLQLVRSKVNISSSTIYLQELRDISSMAMEYFDDEIAPMFTDDLVLVDSNSSSQTSAGTCTTSDISSDLNEVLKLRTQSQQKNVDRMLRKYKFVVKRQNIKIQEMRDEMNEMKKQWASLQRQLNDPDHSQSNTVSVITSVKSAVKDGNILKRKISRECDSAIKIPKNETADSSL